MANPRKAAKTTKRRFGIGRYQIGVVLQKRNPLTSKFPIGSKVTLRSDALAKEYPPITGTVKDYENGKKLLVSFNGKGLTAVSPGQLQPHYEIGNKPVALKAQPLKK